METNNTNINYDLSKIANGKRICLLDLNYTLVSNQAQTEEWRARSTEWTS